MAPYGQPLSRFALDLKNTLEGNLPMSGRPTFMLETYIRTTRKALWDALVNPDKTRMYFNEGRLETSLKPGDPFRYMRANGELMLDGRVLKVVPEKRLEVTFLPGWEAHPEESRVVYELEPAGEAVKLTMTHYDIDKAHEGAVRGWAIILAGLKTYLETGAPLNVPMPG
jgi:uncharacterized protein YndB with AHSA1/START domain